MDCLIENRSNVLLKEKLLYAVHEQKVLIQKIAFIVMSIRYRQQMGDGFIMDLDLLKNSLDQFKENHQLIFKAIEDFFKHVPKLAIFLGPTEQGFVVVTKFIQEIEKLIVGSENKISITNADVTMIIKNCLGPLELLLKELSKQVQRALLDIFDRSKRNVERSQDEIIQILHNITDIASSARMISFNAHIIAERAGGDIGKEFSVVAGGISTLTNRIREFVNQAVDVLNKKEEKSGL